MPPRTRLLAIGAAASLLAVGVGCYFQAGFGTPPQQQESYSYTSTPPGSAPGGANVDPVAIGVVPSGAKLAAAGNGVLAFTAPEDGMVYLYNESDQQVNVSGRYLQGESVIVTPTTGGVNWRSEQRTATGSGGYTSPPGGHRIYFQPDHPTTAPTGGG
jgi:hypothetical protein